jgi:uncharacterized protein (DUF362 family)
MSNNSGRAVVAVLRTSPRTVIDEYKKLMDLAEYRSFISKSKDTAIKLNLSWTKYFPACSSQPWQVEGTVKTLLNDGFDRGSLFAVENRTVVTDPWKGARNNKWLPVLERYGLRFFPLTEQEWTKHDFGGKLLRLDRIFPEGIEIPKLLIGKNVIHLPTIKTHGHSITTGAVKNAFGGLLKEIRHYAHKYIHEVLVDLMIMQKELHPGMFAVMDGTVCGNGAGPRTMIPVIGNYILASGDCVALDAVAASLMGFDPLNIPYIRMCHERGLGVGDLKKIDRAGDDISKDNLGFDTRRSFVIWGDQMLRKGPLRFLEKPMLHSPLVVWAPLASTLYHDFLWYPLIGRNRVKRFMNTGWGRLFAGY